MKYTDMISQIESFKYSSNLKYDLFKDNKMIEYIPTKHIITILSEIFNDIIQGDEKGQASRLIYGAYGTGKSSFLTVLATILGKTAPKKINLQFLGKVQPIDKGLASEIDKYLENSRPYLIVPVDGYFEDFYQCIYYSLTKTLEQNKIQYRLEEPYNEAIEIINRWCAEGNDDFQNILAISLTNYNITISSLVKQLALYKTDALEIFKKVFFDITHGIEFRPRLISFYQNLDTINQTILEHDYRGIVFIFDEFGKYLEDNIAKVNVKAIQDLAEYCDHGQFDNNLILVSHKEMLQYVDIDGLDEWEKVQSRFKPISFEQNDEEIVYLIKNALIKKEPLWKDFKNRHKKGFENIIRQTLDLNIFTSLKEEEFIENIIYGAFPFHPVVAKLLIMLSKKMAQNERTIFTFVAGEKENSLGNFIRNMDLDRFSFIDVSIIYDYFTENILSKRMSYEFDQYLKVQSSINKLKKEDKKYHIKVKIIKAIGVIDLVNNYDSIKPNKQTIIAIIDEKEEEIKESIDQLINEKIIIYSRQYKYYSFFDASSLDIEKLMETTMEKMGDTQLAVDLLNKNYLQVPVLPDEYNYEYKMTRYYYPIYVLDDDLEKLRDFMQGNYYDGLIVFVITDKVKEDLIDRMDVDRSIYIYRKASKKIVKEVKKIMAIEYLLTQKKTLNKKDPKAILELQEYKKEIESYIRNYISEWNDPTYKENIFIAESMEIKQGKIESIRDLSSYMSKQLFYYFDKTLVVNNELINKNKLSPVMAKVRKDIVDKILLSDVLEPSLGYKALSANHTFIRSLLELNDILSKNTIRTPHLCEGGDRRSKAHYVMQEIDKFIEKCETEEVSFYNIIDKLKSPPYGLRDGYIPVLLAAALRRYGQSVYIRLKGADQQLNGELFESIIKNPINYTLAIDHWLEEEENYIAGLENQFQQYINLESRKMGRLKALHEAMLNHYKSISKFSRTTDQFVSKPTLNYRNIIEKETSDYRDFFFKQISKLGENYEDILLIVAEAKENLQTAEHKLTQHLINETKTIFNLQNGVMLEQLMDLVNGRWQGKLEESLSFLTTKFIDVIVKLDKNTSNVNLIEQLGPLLTGFEIGYWSDNQIKEFINSTKDIYNELEKPIEESKGLIKDSIKITLEDEEGRIKRVNLSREDLPENAQILKNILLSNIDNFGQALDHEDKRQVIYEVLKNYI